MKKILTAAFVSLISLNTFAAKYEEKDLLGRLMIMDQETGSVQGIIAVKKATTNDQVLFTLVANVDVIIKDQKVSQKCSGQFDSEEQTLNIFCSNNKDILSLKLSNENSEIASYLTGSFTSSAEISFGERGSKDTSSKILVDVKNLDLK